MKLFSFQNKNVNLKQNLHVWEVIAPCQYNYRGVDKIFHRSVQEV